MQHRVCAADAARGRTPALTFHLLLRSPGVAGGTGHANVVPVDVLEEHLRVPPCQGTGLKETEV